MFIASINRNKLREALLLVAVGKCILYELRQALDRLLCHGVFFYNSLRVKCERVAVRRRQIVLTFDLDSIGLRPESENNDRAID